MERISAVYKIVNTVTNDCYVGSSKDVMKRWANHKCHSTWKNLPNSKLYQDFQKYGIDKFRFQVLAPVEPEYLKQVEQEFIEMLKPVYNDRCSKDPDENHKEANRKARKKYNNQLCSYNGETLKLVTLAARFLSAGIEHATIEAKKYLIK